MTARGGGGCLGALLKPGLARDGPAVNGRVDEEALVGKGGGLTPMFTLEKWFLAISHDHYSLLTENGNWTPKKKAWVLLVHFEASPSSSSQLWMVNSVAPHQQALYRKTIMVVEQQSEVLTKKVQPGSL